MHMHDGHDESGIRRLRGILADYRNCWCGTRWACDATRQRLVERLCPPRYARPVSQDLADLRAALSAWAARMWVKQTEQFPDQVRWDMHLADLCDDIADAGYEPRKLAACAVECYRFATATRGPWSRNPTTAGQWELGSYRAAWRCIRWHAYRSRCGNGPAHRSDDVASLAVSVLKGGESC